MEFINIVSDVTAEIDLDTLLQLVMKEATRMLHADRATLFLNDEKNNEMNSFWNQNNYRKLFNMSVFLIILGGVLSIIELLTENSSSIFLSGIVLLVILKIFKSKFF